PTATAGLNHPPEIGPTHTLPTVALRPMARPKYELPAVFATVVVFSTTRHNRPANRASASIVWSGATPSAGAGPNVWPVKPRTMAAPARPPATWAVREGRKRGKVRLPR